MKNWFVRWNFKGRENEETRLLSIWMFITITDTYGNRGQPCPMLVVSGLQPDARSSTPALELQVLSNRVSSCTRLFKFPLEKIVHRKISFSMKNDYFPWRINLFTKNQIYLFFNESNHVFTENIFSYCKNRRNRSCQWKIHVSSVEIEETGKLRDYIA